METKVQNSEVLDESLILLTPKLMLFFNGPHALNENEELLTSAINNLGSIFK